MAAFLTDRDKATVFKSPGYLCVYRVRIDLVTESLNVGTMVALNRRGDAGRVLHLRAPEGRRWNCVKEIIGYGLNADSVFELFNLSMDQFGINNLGHLGY